jgi:Mg2+/Co2+ transporter CorC
MNAQNILNEVYGTQTQDPVAAQLAAWLAEVTQAYQTEQMSKDEYLELLKDFQAQQLINSQCQDLEAKERLNNIINIVINAAMVLSSI